MRGRYARNTNPGGARIAGVTESRESATVSDHDEPSWEQDDLLDDMLEWVTLTKDLIPRLEEADTPNSDSAAAWLRKAYDPDLEEWTEGTENGSWAITAFISDRGQEIREEWEDG